MNLKFWKTPEKRSGENIDTTILTAWAKYAKLCSEHNALNISAFFAAVNLISNSLAMLPIKVLARDNKGSNELQSHPVAEVFGRTFNGTFVSRFQLVKSLIESVILRGNGFAYIERDGDGNVKNIQFLTPDSVVVSYDSWRNTLYYSIVNKRGKRINRIEPINMLHFVMHTRDGVNGVSLLSYAARSVEIANNSEESAADFFGSGGNVNGYLKAVGTPLSDKQKQQIASAWTAAYGPGGQGVAVLNSNIEYTQLSLKPADAQLLESRQYNVSDIARFFNVSPLLIGGTTGVSYSSVEQLQNYFLTFTLQPWVSMMESELNRKLLKPSESSLEIVLDTAELLRVDKSSQANYYRAMVDAGILSRNEVRRELGYNAFDGGDAHTIAYSDTQQNTLEENNNTDNQVITNDKNS